MSIVGNKRKSVDAAAEPSKAKFKKTEHTFNKSGEKKQSRFNGKGGGGGGKPGFKKPFIKSPYKGKKPLNNNFKGNNFKKDGPKFTDKKPAVVAEKQDWNKFKKDKKDLKLKRKQGKDLFEVTVEGKKLYEKLKCKGTPEKDALAKQLHNLLKGPDNYQKLVLAHDTARIVQCLLKYSPADIRREISENLIPIVAQMSLSKYAHFCVNRMIKYGTPDIKEKVIEAMYGNIVKAVNNAHASTIVDIVYISWASSQQKAAMRQEFYGDLYKTSKDSAVKCIKDTYKDSPHMKLAIINSVKANLNHIVNKKLVDNSLVHAVLLDFLHECSDEERGEMTVSYSPYIPSLASTKEGVRASMIFFWNSIVKDRRAIVKNLKEHLIKLCTHEHGHVLILAIVNAMDDTKALKKAIFDNIFSQIEFVIANEWGRRVIQWFVAPEDTSLFHPQINAFLEEGLKFSKKDKALRRAELIEAVEEPLCNAIAENPSFWLRGGHTGLATAAILKIGKGGNLSNAYEKLSALICDPEWKVSTKEAEEKEEEEKKETAAKTAKKINVKKYLPPSELTKKVEEKPVEFIAGVEHAGLHIVLKKILKNDQENIKTEKPTFSAAIVNHLTTETIKYWITMNRAAFILLNAFENGSPETAEKLKALLRPHISLLKKQSHAGAKLIIKKCNF